VVSAVFSPDGRHILTAEWDGSARWWDAASGLLVSGAFDRSIIASLREARQQQAIAG
jgi:WD40 repeat protein